MGEPLPRPATGRAPAARGGAARQPARVPLRARRCRARGCGDRGPQPHAPGRAPAPRHRADPLRACDHRAEAPRAARADLGRAAADARDRLDARARAGRVPGRRPGPRPVGRHDLGAHLHERDVGRAQGGDLLAAPAHGDRQPHGHDHGSRRRRHRLRLHAAVPLERGAGGLGAVDRLRREHRPGPEVLRVRLPARHPPLWLDVLQLHRQAARLHHRDSRATRRRGQPAAGRVRQRGLAPGGGGVRRAATAST